LKRFRQFFWGKPKQHPVEKRIKNDLEKAEPPTDFDLKENYNPDNNESEKDLSPSSSTPGCPVKK